MLKVEDLASASALDIARDEGATIRRIAFPGVASIEFARLSDVAYFPSALDVGQGLQVVRGRYMPLEAVFDAFTVDFVKPRLVARGRAVLDGFVQSDFTGDVCILGNVFSRNFTHWHEELMKVVALEQAGIGCAYVLSELPPFARDLLGIIGIPPERILEVREPTRFAGAFYSTPISYRNVADYPGVLLALRERLLTAPSMPGHGPRLWLDRGQQTRLGRKLVNEEEVHRLLERHGFERLDMGALPVAAQINIARRAEVIAGLHGSQFVHTQLMQAGSGVIECFSPIYLNPTYTEIYRVMRHRYSQINSTNTPLMPYLHGGDVLVDCQQLDLALSQTSARAPVEIS